MTRTPQDWIILRCKGANTLRLAASLEAAGYECWTPTEVIRHRAFPPPIGKRKGRRKETVPVMASYVFARWRHLPELLRECELPTSQHPDFSLMRHYGEIIPIADKELNPLRVAERKGRPLDTLPQFATGDRVRCDEGGFQGLTGVVEKTRGKFVLVVFPGLSIPVQIEVPHLLPENQQQLANAA